MLLSENIKMALAALRSARWRSLLTMLGIIVGVAAVITTISLGQGLKHQVSRQVGQLGNDLITVRPGQTVKRDGLGNITDTIFFSGGGTLSEPDVQLVQQTPGVKAAAPVSVISGNVETNNHSYPNVPIIATGSGLTQALPYKIAYGGFMAEGEDTKNIAIVGKTAAFTLFGENVPIGQTFRLRGQTILVRGIFEEFPPNPLLPTVDLNKAIFMPYGAVKGLVGIAPPIPLIVVKPEDKHQVGEVASSLTLNLLNAHGGQSDFTVLKQTENTILANKLLQLITAVIVGLAAITLIMGGVGIMNIMLLAVTERTREVGLRKAIGATNRQILHQFLVEASVLSVMGGLVGVVLAFVCCFLIRVFSVLEPAVSFSAIALALGTALLVGIFFGVVPAVKAASKDPIEALRYE